MFIYVCANVSNYYYYSYYYYYYYYYDYDYHSILCVGVGVCHWRKLSRMLAAKPVYKYESFRSVFRSQKFVDVASPRTPSPVAAPFPSPAPALALGGRAHYTHFV